MQLTVSNDESKTPICSESPSFRKFCAAAPRANIAKFRAGKLPAESKMGFEYRTYGHATEDNHGWLVQVMLAVILGRWLFEYPKENICLFIFFWSWKIYFNKHY